APQSAPAHYREMLRLVQAAAVEGAGVGLVVRGSVAPGTLGVQVETRALANAPEGVELALVLFEHGVVVAGRTEPYVARFALDPVRVSVPGNASQQLRLDPAWDLDRVGVVALALVDGRVVQSATWLPRQDAPTVQLVRAPLVEHVTASWCSPCGPADEALILLATQRGPAGPLPALGEGSYLRAPTGWLWAGLALGAAGAVALARGGRP
ncbi:MAG TPA: hypothetical protein VM582_08485, partial [Candidatus Thermoplasmatota archaeon]|nr:hypothetical protein [Candidatus Thermoplasmatota archaeon]